MPYLVTITDVVGNEDYECTKLMNKAVKRNLVKKLIHVSKLKIVKLIMIILLKYFICAFLFMYSALLFVFCKIRTSVEEVEQQEQYELICPKERKKHNQIDIVQICNIFGILYGLTSFAAVFRAIMFSLAIWNIQYGTYLHLNLASHIIIISGYAYCFIAYLQIIFPKYHNLCTYYYDYKLSLLSFTLLCFLAIWCVCLLGLMPTYFWEEI